MRNAGPSFCFLGHGCSLLNQLPAALHLSHICPQEIAPFLRVLGSYPMDTEL